MNESLKGKEGIMLISQFILFGNLKKGFRPSFNRAAPPEKGEAFYLSAAPTDLKVRRINVTPLLRDCMSEDDWEMGPRNGRTCFVRVNKVGKYTYPRLRVVWNSVPDRYWTDAEPIPFSEAFQTISVKECLRRAMGE